MRPLTDHTPKPLLQAGGKPLIVWHIERLVHAGITELVINHAHLGAQIELVLGDGSQFGAQIRYSSEGTALETAGGIAFALNMLGDELFLVVNGDIYCDYDFSRLHAHATQMQHSHDIIHLVLVDNPEHHPSGDFFLDKQRIIQSSSILEPKSSTLTFSGIGLYHPVLFANIPRGTKAPLAPLLREQIALGNVSGEHHRGIWVDVGTPQRLDELDKQLRASQNEPHV
jgi:MurNAc alpha-1-phosphate uridylyltransferase